jgi:hypothetical protein
LKIITWNSITPTQLVWKLWNHIQCFSIVSKVHLQFPYKIDFLILFNFQWTTYSKHNNFWIDEQNITKSLGFTPAYQRLSSNTKNTIRASRFGRCQCNKINKQPSIIVGYWDKSNMTFSYMQAHTRLIEKFNNFLMTNSSDFSKIEVHNCDWLSRMHWLQRYIDYWPTWSNSNKHTMTNGQGMDKSWTRNNFRSGGINMLK